MNKNDDPAMFFETREGEGGELIFDFKSPQTEKTIKSLDSYTIGLVLQRIPGLIRESAYLHNMYYYGSDYPGDHCKKREI